MSGDVDSGVCLIEQALLFNPYSARAHYVSGWLRIFLGKPDLAIENLVRALRLSPSDPLAFKVSAALSYAHLFAGRYDQASKAAEAALRVRPDYLTALRAATAAKVLSGRTDEARRLMTRMQQLNPRMRLCHLADLLPLRRRQDFARWSEALSKAGLPE